MPKIQHRKLKPTKKNWGRRVGVSMAGACVPRASFWRPLPTHKSRTQSETNDNSGGEEQRGKLGLNAPVKEIYLLARATHSPGSGYQKERRQVSLEAEDDSGHGGEVCGIQKLAEMCRSRLEIFDSETLPIFAKTTEDEGDSP
jgi:hypothetical protein